MSCKLFPLSPKLFCTPKYLGLMLQDNIKWEGPVNCIQKKIFRAIAFTYQRGRGAIWNSLQSDCKTASTFLTFEMKLKTMFA